LIFLESDISCLLDNKLEEKKVDEPSGLDPLAIER